MTETRKGQYAPFTPHPNHRQMTDTDAKIFALAADMHLHPYVSRSIRDAGGDIANIAHFSREHCSGRPVDGFAAESGHETIVALLRATGEALLA